MREQLYLPPLDAYSTLIFRGGASKQHVENVCADIELLQRNGPIYPPDFATFGKRIPDHGVTNIVDSVYGGIAPAEAVALQIVANEGSGIAQTFATRFEVTQLLIDLMGDPNCWPMDVAEGMAHFGYGVCSAARIREMIYNAVEPGNRTIGDAVDRLKWDRYKNPLLADGLTIRSKTVAAIVSSCVEQITKNLQGEGTRAFDMPHRFASRKTGIEKAAVIYQEVLALAQRRGLSTAVYPETIVTPGSPRLLA